MLRRLSLERKIPRNFGATLMSKEIDVLNIVGKNTVWDGGYEFIGFIIDEFKEVDSIPIKKPDSIFTEKRSLDGVVSFFHITPVDSSFTLALYFNDDKCYRKLHFHLPDRLRSGVTESNLTLEKRGNEYVITKLALAYV